MNTELNKYLTVKEYNNICKYWRLIEKYTQLLKNFDHSKYKKYENYLDDEEELLESIYYNKKLRNKWSMIEGKIKYYEEEYEKYVNKIGYKLSDQTQNEILFNLLNNGLIMDN